MADKKILKYKDLKEVGVLDLMYNGFNIYVNDDDGPDAEDCMLTYNVNTNSYRSEALNIDLPLDELMECDVEYIGASVDDFLPAIWINLPNQKEGKKS